MINPVSVLMNRTLSASSANVTLSQPPRRRTKTPYTITASKKVDRNALLVHTQRKSAPLCQKIAAHLDQVGLLAGNIQEGPSQVKPTMVPITLLLLHMYLKADKELARELKAKGGGLLRGQACFDQFFALPYKDLLAMLLAMCHIVMFPMLPEFAWCSEWSSEVLPKLVGSGSQSLKLYASLQIKENAVEPLSSLIEQLTKPAAASHPSGLVQASVPLQSSLPAAAPKKTIALQQPSEIIDLTDGDSESLTKKPRLV